MDNDNLTAEQVYNIMKSIYPTQNDYYLTNYDEELVELADFQINTISSFKSLMTKHQQRIMEVDAEPINEQEISWYKEDPTIENIEEKIKNNFWFAFPALIRLALELEFGENYQLYADKRDNI